MKNKPLPGISAKPCGPLVKHLSKWSVVISGPQGSPYEGGKFELEVKIPLSGSFEQKWSHVPPRIKFKTRTFHPNVSSSGEVHVFRNQPRDVWSTRGWMQKALLSRSSLLNDPSLTDPLDSSAAALYRSDRASYDARCREMTRKFAGGILKRPSAATDAASERPPRGPSLALMRQWHARPGRKRGRALRRRPRPKHPPKLLRLGRARRPSPRRGRSFRGSYVIAGRSCVWRRSFK